jgi:hypothetical protein
MDQKFNRSPPPRLRPQAVVVVSKNNNKRNEQKHLPVHVPGAVRTPVSPIAKCIRKVDNLVEAI